MFGEDGEDFDAFNEETFGDAAIAGDWEQQHEKLASLVLAEPFLPGPSPNQFLPVQQLQQLQQQHQRRQYHQHQHQHHQHHQQHHQQHHHHHERKSHGDEYAGLMTASNKEWLIKILYSALNFTNHFKEDFYYVSYKSRQLTAAAKAAKGNDHSQIPALIVPERKADDTNKYVPVQFEGSLGKIQVSNIKCPRKLLDVNLKHSNKEVDVSQDRPMPPMGRAELNAFRRLLLDIEQLYVVMLEIDEEDKKMGALPEDQHKPHVDRRTELCNNLFKGVYDERTENINQRVASIRKGIALIVRSLQVLSDANQKAAIVRSLLDANNSHFVTNHRDKGLHRLDFKEILMETLAQLRESEIPDIDKLTNKLNRLLFKIIDPSCFKLL